jgi:DNA polymerase-1
LNGYLNQKNTTTGLLHPEYRIGMTATGRLSCSNPNIQQAPSDADFRRLFTAPEGHVLVSGDFSQVELRIAAALSRDKVMLDAYANGDDLHTLTAARSAGVSIDKVTKDMRQGAKVLNFGSLYGMRSKALASTTTQTYGVPMSEAEAETALHKFSTTYPQLAEWQRARRQQARNTDQVHSKSGLTRDFNALPAGNRDAEAMNMPVQATGAEILLASLRKLQYPLASTVHDEITIIAPEDKAEEAKAHLNEAMVEGFTEILSEHDQLLNGLVDIKIGSNWAEVH